MNKKQAEEIFKIEILPFFKNDDKPAKREAWHNFTDSLCRDGQITMKQYESWLNPRFVK